MQSNPFAIQETDVEITKDYRESEFEELIGSEADPTYLAAALQGRRRFRLFILFGALALVIFVQIARLQIGQGEKSRQLAEGNRIRKNLIIAPRGNIFDHRGRALATNTPAFYLKVKLKNAPPDFLNEWHSLEPTLGLVGDLPTLVSHELGLRLLPLAQKFPEQLKITLEPARTYPLNHLGTHAIGYLAFPTSDEDSGKDFVSRDRVGRLGVEASYNALLQGHPGEEIIEIDASRGVRDVYAKTEAIRGQDLTLTLDRELTARGGQALERAIATSSGTGGALVVLDVRDCAIRSLVSLPAPPPQDLSRGATPSRVASLLVDPRNPFFNRAIAGTYPPGSTIKPFWAYGALAAGLIRPETTVISTGGIRVGNWFFPDWRPGGHGVVNVTRAISESINTFFYLIGGGSPPGSRNPIKGLGIKGMNEVITTFGLINKSGIDLGGERGGFSPTPEWKREKKQEEWYIGDTYHAAIGQGDVLVTPLALARAYATIANGDFRCRPHLVEGQDPAFERVALDRNSINVVRQALRQTVRSGSARRLGRLPITSAGKTGTAQVAQKRPHAWYAGFAPYENPEIAFAIIIENGGEGGIVAVPVATEILETYARAVHN